MTENKAPQALDVTVKNYEGVAALSPVGTFVFCILCFLYLFKNSQSSEFSGTSPMSICSTPASWPRIASAIGR